MQKSFYLRNLPKNRWWGGVGLGFLRTWDPTDGWNLTVTLPKPPKYASNAPRMAKIWHKKWYKCSYNRDNCLPFWIFRKWIGKYRFPSEFGSKKSSKMSKIRQKWPNFEKNMGCTRLSPIMAALRIFFGIKDHATSIEHN